MLGFDTFGALALGEIADSIASPVLYEPVSRIMSGGAYIPPAQIHTLGTGIHWDDDTIILWDDGTPIFWDE